MTKHLEALPERRLGSVKFVAHMLDCSIDRLYKLLREGELESFLDGRKRQIVLASVDAYIKRCLAASEQYQRNENHPRQNIRRKEASKAEAV